MSLDGTVSFLNRHARPLQRAKAHETDHHDVTLSRGALVSHRLARFIPLRPLPIRLDAPIVSFSFDDAPVSALTLGRGMLEDAGARGTFYLSSSLTGQDSPLWTIGSEEDIRAAANAGHEIGLHTHHHRSFSKMSGADVTREIEVNRAALSALGVNPTRNFAYPFGVASLAGKLALSRVTRSGRSVHPGVNSGMADRDFLKCVELADARLTIEDLAGWIDAAARSKGWLILCAHDVGHRTSRFGASIGLMRKAIDLVLERHIRIETVDRALDCIGAPS